MPTGARVDMRALMSAATDQATDVVYYLDSNNGSVLKIARTMPMAELARFKKESDSDPDRFVKVPRPTSEESYGDMEAFQATVKDKKLQDRLRVAVSGGGTMRNFLDALTPIPAERERWYKFRESRIRERLASWVKQNGMSGG